MRPEPVHLAGSPTRQGLAVLALLVSGALIAAGCGGSSNGGSSSASPDTTAAPTGPAPSVATTAGGGSAATTTPTIENFAFHPDQIHVKVGQKVTWTNKDSTTHTVTADDSSFDSSGLAQGKTFSHTFDKAGTFAYHCAIHSSMTGTVVVS
jgi:plastocyanin